jgi:hypothetical protein
MRDAPTPDEAAGLPVVAHETIGAISEIEIELPDAPTARFRLLWNEAPRTCAAVAEALPGEAECFHAIYSGTITAFLLDPQVTAPIENATTCVLPGDLLFTHYEPHFRHGHQNALSEIYWAYDRYARPTIPGQFVPLAANVFGRYEGPHESWTAFAARCSRLRFEGTVLIKIHTS